MKVLRFLKNNKQFTVFLLLALAIAAIAVFAPWIAPRDPYDAVMSDSLKEPARTNLWGTTKPGRDVLPKVI